MSKKQTQQQQSQNDSSSFDLAISSLRKRGIELTSGELSLCILYSRFNSIAYKVNAGLMSMQQATKEANEAFATYKAKTEKRSSVGF